MEFTEFVRITVTIQKKKFSIKDLFSKCDQIRRKLRIWSHLLHFYVLCLKKCHAHRDYLYNFISDDGANNIFMLLSVLLS